MMDLDSLTDTHARNMICLQAANTVGAFDVFHELCEASKQPETHPAYRLRPDAHTFGALLHACAAAGQPPNPADTGIARGQLSN